MAIRTTYTKIWPYLAEIGGLSHARAPTASQRDDDALARACERQAQLRGERERDLARVRS